MGGRIEVLVFAALGGSFLGMQGRYVNIALGCLTMVGVTGVEFS